MMRVLRTALTAGGIAALSYGLMAVVFAATGQAPAARAFFPSGFSPSMLPANISIISWDRHSAVLTAERSGYVADLYGAGAVLVLPVRKSGCLAYRPPGPSE